MTKQSVMSFFFILLFPLSISANNELNIHAAFVRDGNLWTLTDDRQEQITNGGTVFGTPKWSHDGKLIAYQREINAENQVGQSELWVYDVESGEEKRIYFNAKQPKWSPNKNILSFTSNGV